MILPCSSDCIAAPSPRPACRHEASLPCRTSDDDRRCARAGLLRLRKPIHYSLHTVSARARQEACLTRLRLRLVLACTRRTQSWLQYVAKAGTRSRLGLKGCAAPPSHFVAAEHRETPYSTRLREVRFLEGTANSQRLLSGLFRFLLFQLHFPWRAKGRLDDL